MSCDNILVPYVFLQKLPHCFEDLISCGMAVHIVNILESVNISHYN